MEDFRLILVGGVWTLESTLNNVERFRPVIENKQLQETDSCDV